MNDDWLEPGKGFGTHPHANMEIISVMLEGSMNHKDSMGHNNVVGPGGVQVMGAGKGLFHEEYNVGQNKVNFLQIWIQPKIQETRPRYQSRSFPKEDRKNQLKTIVSFEEGIEHCWINQNAKLSLGYFDAGTKVAYDFLPINKCVYLFCIEGSLTVGGEQIGKRDAIGVWDTDHIEILCSERSEFIVIETVINQK